MEPSVCAYPGLPPDLVIVAIALGIFQSLDLLHRYIIGPRIRAYVSFSFRDRYDWDRRFVNIVFQLAQVMSNTYILTMDAAATADVLYGYSRAAHLSFLVILAFYIHDSAGMVLHPQASSRMRSWLFHHFVAVALLMYNVSYKRASAFPAAAFLISAVGHIPHEIRWFLSALRFSNQHVINATLVLCFAVALFALGVPPPYLLYRVAQQLRISVSQVVTEHMRPYCIFFFLLIYLPHLLIIVVQLGRLFKYWGTSIEPFRTRKVE